MLASCLMFKILSGAKSDIQRYSMLEKIGARRQLLKQSIPQRDRYLIFGPRLVRSHACLVWTAVIHYTFV